MIQNTIIHLFLVGNYYSGKISNVCEHLKQCRKMTVKKVFIYKALKTLLTDVLVHFLQILEK